MDNRNLDLKMPLLTPDLQGDSEKKLSPPTSAECGEGSSFPKVKTSRAFSRPLCHIHSERIVHAEAGKKMIHKSWTGEPETRLYSSTSGESEYSIAAMKSHLEYDKIDDLYLCTTAAKDEKDEFDTRKQCKLELVQQERDVAAKHAQQQCSMLNIQDRLLCNTSEKDSDQLLNQQLSNQVNELQRLQESMMVKHAKKCLLAEERIHRLESEAESLDAEKRENATLITRLELNISALKSTIKDTNEKLRLQGEEMQNEIREYKRKADSLTEQLKDRDNCLYKQKEEADERIREVERKSEQKLAQVREEARQCARRLEDRHGQQIRTLMRVIPMPHAPVHRHIHAIQALIALVLLVLESVVLYHGGETNPIFPQVIFATTLLDLGWEYWLERRVGVGSLLATFLAAREAVGNILPLPLLVAFYVVCIRLMDLALDYNL